jgi:hypothetical protein
MIIFNDVGNFYDPGERRRYNDWLPAERQGGPSLSPGKVTNLRFFMSWCRLCISPSLLCDETVDSLPGVRRPVLEAGHLPPTIAEVTKTLVSTCISAYIFMA